MNLDQTKKHCVFENGTGKIYLSVVAKLKKETREKESTFHDFSFFLWIVQKFSSYGLIKKKKKNTYDAWKKTVDFHLANQFKKETGTSSFTFYCAKRMPRKECEWSCAA